MEIFCPTSPAKVYAVDGPTTSSFALDATLWSSVMEQHMESQGFGDVDRRLYTDVISRPLICPRFLCIDYVSYEVLQ